MTAPQPPDVRAALTWLREADPVLATAIDERPDFDPRAWMRRLPALDLFRIRLSRQKATTVLDLAQSFRDGQLSEAELRKLPDEEAIRQLTAVKGVGPRTAKGALLTALQRPDLVRTDDVALRHAIQDRYGLPHLPTPDEVATLARRWSPYASLASSLLLATARDG